MRALVIVPFLALAALPAQAAIQNKLAKSDIAAVVKANQPAILACLNEHKRKNPASTGNLVMRWSIQPAGKTTAVKVVSQEHRSTYAATCISGLIKGWVFPQHKVQGVPVDWTFPF